MFDFQFICGVYTIDTLNVCANSIYSTDTCASLSMKAFLEDYICNTLFQSRHSWYWELYVNGILGINWTTSLAV